MDEDIYMVDIDLFEKGEKKQNNLVALTYASTLFQNNSCFF